MALPSPILSYLICSSQERGIFSAVSLGDFMLCSLLWLKCVTFLDMSGQNEQSVTWLSSRV
jgi:hypothetical protein